MVDFLVGACTLHVAATPLFRMTDTAMDKERPSKPTAGAIVNAGQFTDIFGQKTMAGITGGEKGQHLEQPAFPCW